MILERLILENFRQFKGRQELVFSDLTERNVTIVHAENGFGKTTLLKALLWVLYGREGLMGSDGQPDDFEMPDRIIHEGLAHQATDPNRLAARVELTFKHDGDRYILQRTLTLAMQNLDANKADVELQVMRDGQTFRLDRPQQRIYAIVPQGIRKLLFFNGERINYLAMERNSDEVTEAIQQMLGLRLLQTTIDDLNHNSVRGKLRTELKGQPTSDEKRALLEDRERAESQLATHKEDKDQIKRNLAAITAEIETIDNTLAANREAHELQTKRFRLQDECKELTTRKTDTESRLSKLIAEDGYTLFTRDLVVRGREIVMRLRSEGKIPAKVLNSFLAELLESESCICSRTLAPGTPEREAVEQLMTYAGDQDFNNAVGALDHAIGLLEGVSVQTEEQLRRLNTERLELIRDLREREEESEEIHQILGGKKGEEVQDLEAKRSRLVLDEKTCHADIGRCDERIEASGQSIEDLSLKIRAMEEQNEDADRAQRRVTAVEDCALLIEDILKAETEELRPLLNKEIYDHFRKIIDRDYWPELSEDFALRIRKRVASAVMDDEGAEIDAALSTGQRTVTSLVFIASLVSLAKRRSEIRTILKGLSGSAYPVAIDSPFGSLSIFREAVARYIPELAPQVLLLVSPTQHEGDVEKALREGGRVGKRYFLAYSGPTMPDRANPDLIINGEPVQQYFPLDDDEYTEIREL